MFGALAKTYYAEKMGIDPANIVSVSIMPCVAKKFECDRPEMNDSRLQGRRLRPHHPRGRGNDEGSRHRSAEPARTASIDDPLGMSTGAAVIFGNTGGVMEAALRTAYASSPAPSSIT